MSAKDSSTVVGRMRGVPIVIASTACVLLLTACTSGGTSDSSGEPNFVAGKDGTDAVPASQRVMAPVLSGKTVDGDVLNVADYKRKVVVLNVWGSWCPPCRAEAKGFETVYQDVKSQGVQFVGINTRDASPAPARAFQRDQGITYPSFYDPSGRLLIRFQRGTLGIQSVPSTLVIDRHGRVAARALGALDKSALLKMVQPLVREK
ncbi:TlpA family protein disulfide reductase [Streptomyces sp. NPDC001279]|uniref:TlpA family protein disulfide reductase n=1 Tax=Streptomyces sp. NPDC001279 TaxID=3364556 RepID=UPI003681F533